MTRFGSCFPLPVDDSMKRLIALSVAIILLSSLVACSRKGDETQETTINATMPIATTSAAPSEAVSGNIDSAAETYMLTTQVGQTMPTIVTTQFDLANEIAVGTTAATEPDVNLTIPSIEAPVVISERAPTVATTTGVYTPVTPVSPENTTTTTTATTTTEEQTVPDSQKKRVALDAYAWCPVGSGNVVMDCSLEGWNGGIKAGKISLIAVSIDGGDTHYVNGAVQTGSDDDGKKFIEITIYSGQLNPSKGSIISFTIPAGAVKSRKGDQMSMKYSASVVNE